MKKYWLLLASLSMAISILSACNADTGTNTGEETEPAIVKNESASGDDGDETASGDDENSVEKRESQRTLSYSVDGEVNEELSILTNSDSQNYSIYKLENFELTGEEPNRDSLYLTENEAVFMRIETISKEDGSLEIITKNMMDTLSSVSIGQDPGTILEKTKLPQGQDISAQVGMEVKTELGTITGVVYERGNLIVRLTIFDRKSYNLTDAFLKMGETIDIKQEK